MIRACFLSVGEPRGALVRSVVPEADGFRLGSEDCPRILPSLREMETWAEMVPPEGLSLITPLSGPLEIGGVLAGARVALAGGWGEVVVNDWGVLEALQDEGKGRLTAGRLLLRLRRGPGERDLEKTEEGCESKGRVFGLPRRSKTAGSDRRSDPVVNPTTAPVLDYFAWGSLLDSPLLGFLRERGVSRLEVDLPRSWRPLPPLPGWGLSLHLGWRLVTVTGNCPWTFDADKGTFRPACSRDCRKALPLRMEAPGLPHSLVHWGKRLLESVDYTPPEVDLPSNLDRFIIEDLPPLPPGTDTAK